MLTTLTTLKKRVLAPDPPQPPHSELEHAHWNREAGAWRTHAETREEADEVAGPAA